MLAASEQMLHMDKSIHTAEYAKFLKLLKQTRVDLGVTQVELANRLEETQTFVSKCERGERRLDVIELRRWCASLGMSFEGFAKQLDGLDLVSAKRLER